MKQQITIEQMSDRNNKVYKTPFKLRELEQNINNIRVFKQVLNEME